jgi:hypothetical protein
MPQNPPAGPFSDEVSFASASTVHRIPFLCPGPTLSISPHTAEQQTISGQESIRSTGQEKTTLLPLSKSLSLSL